MSLNDCISNYTSQLARKGLLRTRDASDPADSSCIRFDSNDYLSLTKDSRLAQAYRDGYGQFPAGSGASMILSGYHDNHRQVEKAFADLLKVDDCLLFSSGYAANLAVTALFGKVGANCIIDKSTHASIYDGLELAKVVYSRFIHNDMTDLRRKLNSFPINTMILTEGIFSMSGQRAPLDVIASLNSQLYVDEAHSFGVLGEQGRGAVTHYRLTQQDVPLRVIPLGKAFAGQGAIVAGQHEWIEAILQAGRSIVYSTAVSPAFSYGVLKTLDYVVSADDRRSWLDYLINYFRDQIKDSPLAWGDSLSQIQQLYLGCPHKAVFYAAELRKSGIRCSAIRSPTVPVKMSGLRISINYDHKPEHISKLFNTLHYMYDNLH